MDYLLFAVTATLVTLQKKTDASPSYTNTCNTLKNSAFVFIKPHANLPATQALVKNRLLEVGLSVTAEGDIDGATIDEKKLIDQHYYAIASKATILPAKDIPVPKDKFQEEFGESWDVVLEEQRACNAMEACKAFGCDSKELDAAWQKAPKVVKFGGGFYCGLVSMNDKELYVFNAFFMTMRSKFVAPGCTIRYFVVEWDPKQLPWSDFRNLVLGPTDPADGPVGSLRRTIFDQYKSLGLVSPPNKGDNGVHASASPFEGCAEQMNWLGKSIDELSFGKALLDSGLSVKTIKDWSVDPRIIQLDGTQGSVFDALEDLDVEDCLAKLVKLNKINFSSTI
ncbi:hypothetical protein MPSEU_001061100 [Mayamaea pseudoterrestris]|nr:hypothetical protein MPSEU_001061100 [Mayamaea pseudoterrestris]